ncbi:hypothetical protein ACIRBX_36005 [Kitasatospora sp. NPDC096147]|uniref:hypothetical protein n=1 Tax=Kitasatospora sp. NPDC096147 TaxID=3364093 RepID=UPI0038084D65
MGTAKLDVVPVSFGRVLDRPFSGEPSVSPALCKEGGRARFRYGPPPGGTAAPR